MTKSAADLSVYHSALEQLARQGRARRLIPRTGIDFTSNDYLGLARSSRLREAVEAALARGTPIGAGGSRLLRGNAPEHEELEAHAATFFHAQRTLYFGGGYVANFAVLSTLPQRQDLILMDSLIHASAHEGARAGRAQVAHAVHNDLDAFEKEITQWRARGGAGRVWICVESLYSMDGDRAPLDELAALADRHEAMLMIDEAHSTGVYGPSGRGLASAIEGRDNVLVLHTCGKALGGHGALVSGTQVLCDFLINRCRPFIYATAPSPLMAVAALESLKILHDEPQRRRALQRLVTCANEAAQRQGFGQSGSHILPIIVGENAKTVVLAEALQRHGFDVRAIRPPTVAAGTARLRISITLNVDEASISSLFGVLAEAWQSA